MAKESQPEVKAGILIFAAIIVLLVLTFMVGKFHFFEKGYNLKVDFNFVEGLDIGAPVRLSGVKVGNVTKIGLDSEKSMVTLTLWLEGDAHIREDSKFYLNTLGFMGEKYIEINPGVSSAFLKPGAAVEGERARRLEELITQGQEIAGEAGRIISSIRGLTDKLSLDQMEAAIGDFGKLMKELEVSGTSILRNVDQATMDLKEITSSGKGDVQVAISRLKDTLVKLDRSAASLNVVLGKIERGEGAVGVLLNDPQVAKDLKEMIANFREFSETIKDNPAQLLWGGKKK